MSWGIVKKAINSTVGTESFKPLDQIIKESADESGAVVPTGTFKISQNGVYEIGKYKYVEIDVEKSVYAPTIVLDEHILAIIPNSRGTAPDFYEIYLAGSGEHIATISGKQTYDLASAWATQVFDNYSIYVVAYIYINA